MAFHKKMVFIFLVASVMSGCAWFNGNSASNSVLQEDIYVKTKNYADLITLYRNELKKNEDHKMRFKLANLYYLNGDYRSSLFYLKPLLSNEDSRVYHLQAKNLISLGNYSLAINFCNKILAFNNRNAEAYNLRGVAQSLSGRLLQSKKSFITARQLFIDDVTVNNNLAMVSLLNHQYTDAVNILFPLYINGHNHPQLVHNLIFGLVKSGDLYHARVIIEKEKISADTDRLLRALQRVDLLELRRS